MNKEHIRILFFGHLAELSGTPSLEITGQTDTATLLEYLLQRFPDLKGQVFQMALNKKLVQTICLLEPGDEIALLAPFAGG
jgi:molybdopterin synthase sulfur carrier subunit